FEDEVQVLLLLSSLPDSWSGTTKCQESSSSLLNTEDIGRSSNRRDGGRGKSKTRKRSQSKNRKDITCWICKEKGHFKNQYSKPLADKGKKEMNMAADSEDDALIYCVKNSTESCILDFGASCHTSYSRDVMQNFKKYSGKVRLADNKCLDITRLDDEGHHVTFGNHQWKVTKGNLVVARGQKRGTLYIVEVSNDEPHAVEKVGAPTLWHQRLGHMSENGMKMLVS
ncbi:putative RNA-directed DNA polymerase, partial [Tanacetum coccineum]